MKTLIQLALVAGMIAIIFTGCKKDEENNDPGNGGGDTGTVTDIDGNVYNTVIIGDQIWTAEDLKTSHYNDGTPINNGISGYYILDSTKSSAYASRGYKYYQLNGNVICPSGWHLPSKQEWRDLVGFVSHDNNGIHGGSEATALKAKEGWIDNGNGTDDYGFAARANGAYVSDSLKVLGQGEAGYWLSSDAAHNGPWIRYMWHYRTTVSETTASRENGYSVRCMKD